MPIIRLVAQKATLAMAAVDDDAEASSSTVAGPMNEEPASGAVTETAGGLPANATAVRDRNPATRRAAGKGTAKRLLIASISRQYD